MWVSVTTARPLQGRRSTPWPGRWGCPSRPRALFRGVDLGRGRGEGPRMAAGLGGREAVVGVGGCAVIVVVLEMPVAVPRRNGGGVIGDRPPPVADLGHRRGGE